MSSEFASGCLIDPAVTDATVVSLTAFGQSPARADNPQIQGAWERLKARGVKAIMMPQLMQTYFPNRKNDLQNGNRNAQPAPDPGTCVSRGTYRACMLSYLRQIDQKRILGKPVVFAYEPIYIGGRITIGKGRMGSGGGMYGGWAAEWVSRYGVCERKKYGSMDLSQDTPIGRTDLATSLGNRGGLQQDVIEASKLHSFNAHLSRNTTEALDALASEFCGAFSRNATGGERDQYGMSRYQPSAHCETVCGAFVAHDGRDGILHLNSWGDSPGGPRKLVLQGGETFDLPPGAYGVYASEMEPYFRNSGEIWHFECREGSQFR